ncbi:MAG: hypothetical protein JWQ42_2842 [Edaphobacter sp.]|nr:hypothetical protein [Edaphobacter sp.]
MRTVAIIGSVKSSPQSPEIFRRTRTGLLFILDTFAAPTAQESA